MPTTTVDVQELPSRWAELIALAKEGTEIIVTEGSIPCARLVPLVMGQSRIAGLHPGMLVPTDDFDDPLPAEFWTDSL